MVDQFSDLETKGTTSLIVLLFIVVSKEGGRLSILLYICHGSILDTYMEK